MPPPPPPCHFRFRVLQVWSVEAGFDITSVPGRAVKYFTTATTWEDAETHCESLGGYLITANSDKVIDWLAKQDSLTWIGLHDSVCIIGLD